MTVSDIREAVPFDTVLWIQQTNGEYCEAVEAYRLSRKYDDKAVNTMYPEHYGALGCTGITVVLED